MAHGVADNFLLTAYLSAKCPVFFAPAMDLDMYKHPVTQQNIKILQSFGNHLIEPVTGELASGLTGAGRMEEPEKIMEIVTKFFSQKKNSFNGKKILVTAGPTYEAVDPVRFLGNHSSGKMGFCIAEELDRRGAEVTLVTGPTAQVLGYGNVTRRDVVSADQMMAACKEYFPGADILIMTAAVADFKPKTAANRKIKKSGQGMTLELVPTTDILATLSSGKRKDQLIVGFALETDKELDHARKKLMQKNLDVIVLNSLQDSGAGFGTSTNKITVLDKTGNSTEFPLKSKEEVAADIADYLTAIIKPSWR
jgi:phosphopantothenoylcysteine decarboxylase/phosphopantothenate--cysteine ligase